MNKIGIRVYFFDFLVLTTSTIKVKEMNIKRRGFILFVD